MDSYPAKTCHSRGMPPTKSNLYFPKATVEAVSNISVKKEENCNVWYILDTKSGKNRYFLGVGETSQGKTPSPKCPKDVSREKIDL